MKKIKLEIRKIMKNKLFLIIFIIYNLYSFTSFYNLHRLTSINYSFDIMNTNIYYNGEIAYVNSYWFRLLMPMSFSYQLAYSWSLLIIFGSILCTYSIGQEFKYKTYDVKSVYESKFSIIMSKIISVFIMIVTTYFINMIIIQIYNYLWMYDKFYQYEFYKKSPLFNLNNNKDILKLIFNSHFLFFLFLLLAIIFCFLITYISRSYYLFISYFTLLLVVKIYPVKTPFAQLVFYNYLIKYWMDKTNLFQEGLFNQSIEFPNHQIMLISHIFGP